MVIGAEIGYTLLPEPYKILIMLPLTIGVFWVAATTAIKLHLKWSLELLDEEFDALEKKWLK